MKLRTHRGYALATILILLGVCMFGAAALITVSTLESKISRSQTEGTVAYYVAESGIQDGIWRLNNNSTYNSALIAGTLNVSYTTTNVPASGQGFVVTMTTGALGAGNALVDVVGTSNNGTFTSQRHLQATVFVGSSVPNFGNNAFFGGGGLSITDGSATINVNGGDIFSRGSLTINQATINMPGQYMEAVGNYVSNNSTVTSAGTHSANNANAPADIATPGFNFTQYNSLPTTKCVTALYASQTQLRCTPAQLQTLIGASNNFSFPNAVVYVDGNLTLNNWVKNKTITINGLFVVNGDMSVTGAATNFHFNVNDPGSNQSGIIIKSNLNNSAGTWVVNGVMYASGAMSFSNSQSMTVNGAIVAGGAINVNTGLALNLTYNAARGTAVLGGSAPTAVQTLHWEEEY